MYIVRSDPALDSTNLALHPLSSASMSVLLHLLIVSPALHQVFTLTLHLSS
jgi:hypothetical protein